MTSLVNLGIRLKRRRGVRAIREVAKEIGISHSTLSRLENGKLPDIETFKKVCEWLKIDPGLVLGYCSDSTKNEIGFLDIYTEFYKLEVIISGAFRDLEKKILQYLDKK